MATFRWYADALWRQLLTMLRLGPGAVLVSVGLSASALQAAPAEDRAAGPSHDPAHIEGLLEKSAAGPLTLILRLSLMEVAGREYTTEGSLPPDEAERQRQAIRAVGETVGDLLEAHGAEILKSYDTLPLLAVRAGPDAIRAAASEPRVLQIFEDVPSRPQLLQSVPLVGARRVLNRRGFTGNGWAVAVLDTGVDATHPFLADRIVAEACFSSASGSVASVCPGGEDREFGPGAARFCAFEGCEHGTHVTGIAAGFDEQIAGVARGADIIAVQVFSAEQGQICAAFGLSTPCILSNIFDQLDALEWVYEQRTSFDIAAVNMSLGGGFNFVACDGDPRKLAIDNLRAVGIATVIASGNDGRNGGVSTPACISSAVAVGSTTKSDRISFFSNHGALVDLLAPGSWILSSFPGARFGFLRGTSMATPHVAGAFAVLREAAPNAPVDRLENALAASGPLLRRAAVPIPRIQLFRALRTLEQTGDQPVNDDFLLALPVAGRVGVASGSNAAATEQERESVHGERGSGRSIWWSWHAPASGPVTISTAGSSFDTVLAVYRGTRLDRLSEVAVNDDRSEDDAASEVTFDARAGRTYVIAVDSATGEGGQVRLGYFLDTGEPLPPPEPPTVFDPLPEPVPGPGRPPPVPDFLLSFD